MRVLVALLGLLTYPCVSAQDANRDQFTYELQARTTPNNQYPPKQWKRVRCGDLEECVGWPEKFLAAPDWKLEQNDCLWCPASGNSCGRHHNSPINLERNRAVRDSKSYNPCIDVHRMNFFDSSCTFDELIRLDAFSIERHALQIKQPIEPSRTGGYRNACRNEKGQNLFGKIDYSKGFSNWWFLSHTDIHVPSEHTQEGKRYDAELQMYHFYSVTAAEAGVPNQMGTVAIFLEAGDYDDYPVLNKLICQWRRVEQETRKQCGLSSSTSRYSGCNDYAGADSIFDLDSDGNRNLRGVSNKTQSIHDALMDQLTQAMTDPSMYEPLIISEEKAVGQNADKTQEDLDVEWDEYIRSWHHQQEEDQRSRHLAGYQNVPWHNYFGLLDVKTEYYFRYSGTQTIPPCFGEFLPGPNNRANTNHWRVMKDPLRISNRQLNELHRLLKNRIAPSDDPIRPCKPDTAGGSYKGNSDWVNVSRPLQSTNDLHYKVFCECENWKSRFSEDQAWCTNNQQTRFYKQPYNFQQRGF